MFGRSSHDPQRAALFAVADQVEKVCLQGNSRGDVFRICKHIFVRSFRVDNVHSGSRGPPRMDVIWCMVSVFRFVAFLVLNSSLLVACVIVSKLEFIGFVNATV